MRDPPDTLSSPVYRAVWENACPFDQFQAAPSQTDGPARAAMDVSLGVVRAARSDGGLFDDAGKLTTACEQQLAAAGYWGLLIEREYGGHALRLRDFMLFLTQMSSLEPTVAGLLSVHNCIGATNHLRHAGTSTQKDHWLPRLASGERLAMFALTERNAGTDLTSIRARAVREGDDFLLSGEKMLLTNAAPGRLVALVGRVDDRLGMFVFPLPDVEGNGFQWINYGLHALRHTWNRGFRLDGFRVPASALLPMEKGDGLSLAYHGLNRGRAAVCANAAGTMRILLAGLLPWVRFRRTYGEPIGNRELITHRLARLAALITGADALSLWCGTLLDQGQRGELEGIVAKTFASHALREAALDIALKTHGGRSFLHGHRIGDYLHDYLAPGIYEGESDILSLAFFRALTRQHATEIFTPLQKAAERLAVKRLLPWHPYHLWMAREALTNFARWNWQQFTGRRVNPPADIEPPFRDAVMFAVRGLHNMSREITRSMIRYGRRISNQQCRMLELSRRVQKLITLLVVAQHGARSESEIIRQSALILCDDLRIELSGARPSDEYYQRAHQLGRRIVAGEFPLLEAREPAEPLFPYDNEV